MEEDFEPRDGLCSACEWWEHRRGRFGMCHRLPPVATTRPDGTVVTLWPSTAHDARCGEWEPQGLPGVE